MLGIRQTKWYTAVYISRGKHVIFIGFHWPSWLLGLFVDCNLDLQPNVALNLVTCLDLSLQVNMVPDLTLDSVTSYDLSIVHQEVLTVPGVDPKYWTGLPSTEEAVTISKHVDISLHKRQGLDERRKRERWLILIFFLSIRCQIKKCLNSTNLQWLVLIKGQPEKVNSMFQVHLNLFPIKTEFTLQSTGKWQQHTNNNNIFKKRKR